jgi:hypothetical protein
MGYDHPGDKGQLGLEPAAWNIRVSDPVSAFEGDSPQTSMEGEPRMNGKAYNSRNWLAFLVSVVAIAVVAVLGLPISNNQAATPEPPPGGRLSI